MENTEQLTQEDPIQQALEKHNVTDAALKEMEEQYMQLTVKDVHDKEGLKLVYDARIKCKNTRVLTSKLCKAGREDAIRIQREWLAKEKDITGRISVVEKYLQDQEDIVENEKRRIKEEKDRKEQERIQNRIAQLLQHGMSFNGDCYSIADIVITPLQVKTLDDFTYNSLFAQVEAAYKIEQEKQAEDKRKREEEAERIRKVAEEQRLQAQALAAKEKALAEKEAEIKAAAEAKARAIEEQRKKIAEEQAAADAAKIKQRSSELHTLGLGFNGEGFRFGANSLLVNIPQADLLRLNQEEWSILVESTRKIVIDEKARLEKEQAIKLEAEKKAAAEKARLEAEARIKAEEEAKLKAIQEEEARLLKEASLRPDKEKLEKLAADIIAFTLPELTTEEGKVAMTEIKDQFSRFGAYLNKKAKELK